MVLKLKLKLRNVVVITLLVLQIMVIPALADDPPKMPMAIYGEVINTDTYENAPDGTIVVINTSTGESIQSEVRDGFYGEPFTERVVIPETSSFDVIVRVEDKEISIASYTWTSGDIKRLDIHYSLEDEAGEIIERATDTGNEGTDTDTDTGTGTSGTTGSGSGSGGGGGGIPPSQTEGSEVDTSTGMGAGQSSTSGEDQSLKETQDGESVSPTPMATQISAGSGGVEESGENDNQWGSTVSILLIALAISVVVILVYFKRT